MIELIDKAEKYAAEKTNQVMAMAIAQAFADGYRTGYQDCKDKIPVDLRNKQTEFIDLGLPSGTLWANDYEKDGDSYNFLSHEMAITMKLPTTEQWRELTNFCKWEFVGDETGVLKMVKCVGPNGNDIVFYPTGCLNFVRKILDDNVFFWTKDEFMLDQGSLTVRMWLYQNEGFENIEKSSYKLPVRLVKSK